MQYIKYIFFYKKASATTNEAHTPNDATSPTNPPNERKDSVQSEYNLELPDEDDLQPLTDFNEKTHLTKYPDGTYGCMVLVRQPFRNPNLLYKNALQKMTEVRTWTECLVKLVSNPLSTSTTIASKKLIFFNMHELMSLATELEMTLENVIETRVVNDLHQSLKKATSLSGTTGTSTSEETKETPKEQQADEVEAEKPHMIKPFHEIELKASHKFTDMCLQQFDTYTKIHTFKLQEIVFKEALTIRPDRLMALPERFFKRFTKPKVTSLIDHTPIPFEICKFGHLNYNYLNSFLLLLQDAFWSLPTITRKLQREQQLEQLNLQASTSAMPVSISSAAATLFSFGKNTQIATPTLSSVTSSHTREEVTVKVN